MGKSEIMIRSAVAGRLALGVAAGGGSALAAKGDNGKCGGIVKAGKNDCGASKSSCAGTSKVENDKEAWLYVPTGTCERITGGYIVTSKFAMPACRASSTPTATKASACARPRVWTLKCSPRCSQALQAGWDSGTPANRRA